MTSVSDVTAHSFLLIRLSWLVILLLKSPNKPLMNLGLSDVWSQSAVTDRRIMSKKFLHQTVVTDNRGLGQS